MEPGGIALQSPLSVTYFLEKVPEDPKRFFPRFYEAYQSDHGFDESNTIELFQIDNKVLSPLRFERAKGIRGFQKKFANLEYKLIWEFCQGFLIPQKPDQFFKNPLIPALATQASSFLTKF